MNIFVIIYGVTFEHKESKRTAEGAKIIEKTTKMDQFQVTCQVFVHDHLVMLPPLVKRIPLKIIKQKYEVSYHESEGGDTN